MIVGVAAGARVPSPDRGLFAVEYADYYESETQIPTGPFDPRVVEEAQEDLDAFAEALEGAGVTVRRPAPTDHAKRFGTPDWASDGQYNYCPRDVLLTIGDTVIESPMALRSRYFETFAYKEILSEYFESGANWIAAPNPRLPDDMWNVRPQSGSILNDLEPIFDAANVLRVGRDVLYLLSCSGNMLGLRWLRRVLGDGYRIHPISGVYDGTHLDTTIALVRPGLVVLNPERMRPDQVPALFQSWDVIWCPPMVDTGWVGPFPRASIWQGMNFIMINPELAVVNELQTALIKELERRGVDVIPLAMRHARTLCGGFHCVSLDVRRAGPLEDYS